MSLKPGQHCGVGGWGSGVGGGGGPIALRFKYLKVTTLTLTVRNADTGDSKKYLKRPKDLI